MSKYDNSGIVFVNDKKEKDSHPDRKGSATIDGVEYWISGWLKTGDKGPFLTLAFKRKEERSQEEPKRKTGFAGDIPF